MSKKEQILEFLQKNKLAVIATCASDIKSPESALIAYCEDSELCLYFQSNKYTRKVQNLKVNPNVSCVIGLDMNLVTMQYEGYTKQITTPNALEVCKQLFITKKIPNNWSIF